MRALGSEEERLALERASSSGGASGGLSVSTAQTANQSTSSTSTSSSLAASSAASGLASTTTSTSMATLRAPTAALNSIKPPHIFDNKKEGNFEHWATRLEQYLSIIGMPLEGWTGIMLLNLSSEVAHTAKCLGVISTTTYAEGRKKLMEYFAPGETIEELRGRFQTRVQEPEETFQAFAKDLRILAARAFPGFP